MKVKEREGFVPTVPEEFYDRWEYDDYDVNVSLTPTVEQFMYSIGKDIHNALTRYEFLYDLLAQDNDDVKELESQDYFKYVFAEINTQIFIAIDGMDSIIKILRKRLDARHALTEIGKKEKKELMEAMNKLGEERKGRE